MICKPKFLFLTCYIVCWVPLAHSYIHSFPTNQKNQNFNNKILLFPQQLFRSQNPASNSGQPSGGPQLQQTLPLSSQQYLQQQNPYAPAQQPYVINPGQDVPPYMGLIAAGMPQYYGMAPWSMYPTNLIPQPNQQPRRPLTPSQQGAENQPYQVCLFAFLNLFFFFEIVDCIAL